jgi:hypothetical protein
MVLRRKRLMLRCSACLLAWIAGGWGLSFYHARASAAGGPLHDERAAWTLSNAALSLKIHHLADGSLEIASFRERAALREWCDAGADLFRIEGTAGARRFSLSARDRWRVLEARPTRQVGVRALELRLRSETAPLQVILRWRLERGSGPLVFSYSVAALDQPVTITRADSLSFPVRLLPGPAVLHWVRKGRAQKDGLRKEQQELEPGVLHSLACSPTTPGKDDEIVPWLLVENGGGGWYFGWAFSGLGRFSVRRSDAQVTVAGGLDTTDFRHDLRPGEPLAVPPVLIGAYPGAVDDGLAGLHAFLRDRWMPTSPDARFPLVQYNTWTALGATVNQENVLAQMLAARDLGAELFHLDAGWYRVVGDWRADAARFPHGLQYLSDRAHRLGMKFGLWVAWTQAGPRLLRGHPAWLVSPEIDPEAFRPNPFASATLCLGHRPVREWLKRELDRIVRDYRLDYLEFDNSMIESCHRADHTHQPGDGAYAATLGLYEVLDWLRARHPRLILEDCCGGGNILDYGILRHTHLASLSDLYAPADNRRCVYGATYPFPASFAESYMAAGVEGILEHCRSCMMGLWSISADTARWSATQRAECRQEIARYKTVIRPLLRTGQVRHVLRQAGWGKGWDGLAFDRPDAGAGVLFAFRRPDEPPAGSVPAAAALRSRRPAASYHLRVAGEPREETRTAAELAAQGIPVTFASGAGSALVSWQAAAGR